MSQRKRCITHQRKITHMKVQFSSETMETRSSSIFQVIKEIKKLSALNSISSYLLKKKKRQNDVFRQVKAEETHFQQTKPQDVFQAEWKWYKMEIFIYRKWRMANRDGKSLCKYKNLFLFIPNFLKKNAVLCIRPCL